MAFVWGSLSSRPDVNTDLLIAMSPHSQLHRRVQVVKRHIDPATGHPAPEAAIASFRSLQRLHELSSRSMILAAPQPLELQPELGVVVMEYVPGPTLEMVFRKAATRQACRAAEQAGRWLAELQDIGGQVEGHIDVARILGHIREISAPSSFSRDVAETLIRSAPVIAQDAIPFVAVYGDFKPANLILAQDRIFGVDPGLAEQGPFAHDAAYFLNHVALLWPHWTAPVPFSRSQKLGAAFLDGYRQQAGVSLAGAHLTWLRLANAARMAANLHAWSIPVRRKIIHWQIENLVRQLRNELNTEIARMSASGDTPQSNPPGTHP